jgi:hypothetical protein
MASGTTSSNMKFLKEVETASSASLFENSAVVAGVFRNNVSTSVSGYTQNVISSIEQKTKKLTERPELSSKLGSAPAFINVAMTFS